MSEHAMEWLAQYYDGELNGARLHQVETHLAECTTCQDELDALSNLSNLLRLDSAPRPITPPERFVAQVGLRLPAWRPTRLPAHISKPRSRPLGWWLFPVGVLGMQAFLQAVLTVTVLIVALIYTYQLPGLTFQAWNIAESFVQLVAIEMAAAIVTAILLSGWLASWVINRQATLQS